MFVGDKIKFFFLFAQADAAFLLRCISHFIFVWHSKYARALYIDYLRRLLFLYNRAQIWYKLLRRDLINRIVI